MSKQMFIVSAYLLTCNSRCLEGSTEISKFQNNIFL